MGTVRMCTCHGWCAWIPTATQQMRVTLQLEWSMPTCKHVWLTTVRSLPRTLQSIAPLEELPPSRSMVQVAGPATAPLKRLCAQQRQAWLVAQQVSRMAQTRKLKSNWCQAAPLWHKCPKLLQGNVTSQGTENDMHKCECVDLFCSFLFLCNSCTLFHARC